MVSNKNPLIERSLLPKKFKFLQNPISICHDGHMVNNNNITCPVLLTTCCRHATPNQNICNLYCNLYCLFVCFPPKMFFLSQKKITIISSKYNWCVYVNHYKSYFPNGYRCYFIYILLDHLKWIGYIIIIVIVLIARMKFYELMKINNNG